eukprot:jgi/Ulvmu1/10101/UM006_0051.1
MQLKRSLPICMLMLAALATLGAVPAVHASQDHEILSHTGGELMSPYITTDAFVTGEAGPEVQAAFAGELGGLTGSRHLLTFTHHGLPSCHSCKIYNCHGHSCSGHCKDKYKVYSCNDYKKPPPPPPKKHYVYVPKKQPPPPKKYDIYIPKKQPPPPKKHYSYVPKKQPPPKKHYSHYPKKKYH